MSIVVREPGARARPGWSLPRAVLFDLDDTLVDRTATLRMFTTRFVGAFGGRLLTRDVATLHVLVQAADRGGYRTRQELAETLASALPWRSAPRPESLARYWGDHFGGCSIASPGAIDLVASLRERGVKTGVITNGPPSQHVKIDALGLRPHLDTIVVSEEVGVAKPDRAIFDLALDRLDVSPFDAWFIGDHPVNDVMGAHAAGLDAIWLRRGLDWPLDHPPVGTAIDSLTELAAMLSADQ